jgi:hypothetical protein
VVEAEAAAEAGPWAAETGVAEGTLDEAEEKGAAVDLVSGSDAGWWGLQGTRQCMRGNVTWLLRHDGVGRGGGGYRELESVACVSVSARLMVEGWVGSGRPAKFQQKNHR